MNTRKRKLVLPERIGRYDVDSLLGKGGQGVVLLAHDRELDRHVALKLLKPSAAQEDGTLASEARIVSQLQHPNIVTLFDVGTYNGMNYLVFEYIGTYTGELTKSHGNIVTLFDVGTYNGMNYRLPMSRRKRLFRQAVG